MPTRPLSFLRALARLAGRTTFPVRSPLAEFDDRLLDDMGVSRRQAEPHLRLPDWDVPRSWRL